MIKKFLYILLFTVFNTVSTFLIAQIDTNKYTIYTPEYNFNNGIYINISQVKGNNPISSSRIITNIDINNIDFYKQLTKGETIRYFDLNGVENAIKTDDIWGYCSNNKIYIKWKDDFNLIPVFGSACHFLANEQVYSSYNDPFYNGNYPISYASRTTTELKQYILDLKNEKIYDFSWQNVETLLTNDIKLYEEYTALKKRKKKQMAYIYLRRYNDNNPIYLPKN